MKKKKVLFICVHNSARSQMAEAFLNQICDHELEAQSAGLEPGVLNPIVVEVMREIGIDLSQKETQSVADVLKSGQSFSYVITVCAESEAKGCPVSTNGSTRLHWPFEDPSRFEGDREVKLRKTREVRDGIRAKVEQWCSEVCPSRKAAGS